MVSSLVWDGLIGGVTLCASCLLWLRFNGGASTGSKSVNNGHDNTSDANATKKSETTAQQSNISGYILNNAVTHARLLPTSSKHAFTYPTVSLFLRVSDLDSSQGGFLFGVGPKPWRRVCNIRKSAYLLDDGREELSFFQRLENVLSPRSVDMKEERLTEVWVMTMPSFLGFEGINPLTVWFLYEENALQLKVVVLEVHNTFGERHIYVLRTDVGEDADRPPTFDHHWTFPRTFHVSPFNDRSGYYTCSISGALHPSHQTAPKPIVRIHYHIHPSKKLKLSAITRTVSSCPLTSSNLLRTFAKTPFILFLTLAKISYQAAILHYGKRLNVYARPEPFGDDEEKGGGGVGWQPESWMEHYARRKVGAFLEQRVQEFPGYIEVRLVGANPIDPGLHFVSQSVAVNELPHQSLTIHYLTPRFFTLLLSLPSASHLLKYNRGNSQLFTTSSEPLFLEIFEPPPILRKSWTQRLRIWLLPSNAPKDLASPPTHFLVRNEWMMVTVILIMWAIERIEKSLYQLTKTRFVPGGEPWNGWAPQKEGNIPSELGSYREPDA